MNQQPLSCSGWIQPLSFTTTTFTHTNHFHSPQPLSLAGERRDREQAAPVVHSQFHLSQPLSLTRTTFTHHIHFHLQVKDAIANKQIYAKIKFETEAEEAKALRFEPPETPYPKPCTLSPQFFTRNPTPCTTCALDSKSITRYPEPCTLHSHCSTLNPMLYTLYQKPCILNSKP